MWNPQSAATCRLKVNSHTETIQLFLKTSFPAVGQRFHLRARLTCVDNAIVLQQSVGFFGARLPTRYTGLATTYRSACGSSVLSMTNRSDCPGAMRIDVLGHQVDHAVINRQFQLFCNQSAIRRVNIGSAQKGLDFSIRI